MSGQLLHYHGSSNSAVGQQSERPERPNLFRVVLRPGRVQKIVETVSILRQPVSSKFHFYAGMPNPQVTGSKRSRGQVRNLGIPFDLSLPAVHARRDLVDGSLGFAHGAFQQRLGLSLRIQAIQLRQIVLREIVRRVITRGFGGDVSVRGKQDSDMLPGGAGSADAYNQNRQQYS